MFNINISLMRKTFLFTILITSFGISQNWFQIGSDIDGEAAGDWSGYSISLSSDGNRVAIGAYGNDGTGDLAGHARIYSESVGAWTQVGADIDGEAAGDHSGRSVSLSSDGKRVAIGAHGNDGTGDIAGHARIYMEILGSGTIGDPYQIATLYDLLWLSQQAGNSDATGLYWSRNYIQTANIDATATSGWNSGAGFSPIGTPTWSFLGDYNGQNYSISNLFINRGSSDNIGLFGYANGFRSA